MFTVQDMMSTHVITLTSKNTISDAKCLMESHRIRHVPIVNEQGQLEGLVTQRDVLAAQTSSLEKAVGDNDPMMTPLSRFLQRSLYTVSPCAGLKAAALYMQEHKIGCLPVIKNDKLVGIITDSDFVAIAITLLEIQEETEPMEQDEDSV
ncbi:CBS domain-containing protein [Grimontia hollisae]|uniref:Hypoxic response protein 1 n=2 Tax=Grimontia hollisae TaxID=673 RepID=A0A377HRB4_GRIHO|nr:CBS domain-containing protein [Grimontia hollisae]AMG31177.1 CBS domain-containing protein [Grimontia hollisae]MDF2185322.1 CBS domain-containing protein [Grimontia hollisae]STO46449.1 Hypoxic response protein 1 [Grimontia hollisae]STO58272.1 Hypoxic response protein 1 [Grimontia hollisae]STQ76796.1 Hypoxic response protein 1 [Grimontia hollisae]